MAGMATVGARAGAGDGAGEGRDIQIIRATERGGPTGNNELAGGILHRRPFECLFLSFCFGNTYHLAELVITSNHLLQSNIYQWQFFVKGV